MLDKPLWDDVQAVLAANRVERATGVRGSHPSLLTGMVFDETGERLTPTFKIGAKVVSSGRYIAFQMAEVAIPKNLFADILRLIAELRPPPASSTA
jgi:hypothetical protein